MAKLVTICVPTFNSEETISNTLNSLVSQTYSNVNIIVFDNCSTDSTVLIVKNLQKLHKNLTLVESETNIGAERNFTRCMQVEGSDYTAIFHADDVYFENIIQEQVQVLEKGEHIAVAVHALTIDMQEKVTGKRFIPNELRKEEVSTLNFDELLNLTFKYGNFITCPSVLIKSDILKDQIKSWKGSEYKTSADLDVWLRLSKIGNIAFISKPLMKYRVGSASISFNMKKARTTRHDIFLVIDQYLQGTSLASHKLYDFLVLKDSALRLFNMIRIRDFNSPMPLFNPFQLRYISQIRQSSLHLKLFIQISIIWFICLPYIMYRKSR